jgi:uncharacterized Rossmann fold enzyme
MPPPVRGTPADEVPVKRPRLGDRNVTMTAALGAALIALAAFVIQGTVRTSEAADEQQVDREVVAPASSAA